MFALEGRGDVCVVCSRTSTELFRVAHEYSGEKMN